MKKDKYIAIIFFVLLLFFTGYLSLSREIDFGAEYRCIAKALLRGEGFSDPFCSPDGNSGKTAWMPPFLSYFQAFIYIIFGQKTEHTIQALIFLTSAAASVSLFLLLRLANEVNSRYRHIIVILFSGYLLVNPNPLLLSFHDVWLISLASVVMVYVLYFHFIKRTLSVAPVICLAIWLPLLSPILSFAFLSVTGLLFLKKWTFDYLKHQQLNIGEKTNPFSAYKFLTILIAFAVPVIMWGTRNYVVFNKFIPVKSNLWFDFHQANVYDEDGLISSYTFANFHPIKNREKLHEYQLTGEIELMDMRKRESLSYLTHNTPDYISKIKNRLVNTFIFTINPYDEGQRLDEQGLTASDITLLKRYNIASEHNSLNMHLDEHTLINIVNDSELENKAYIISMWQSAINEYYGKYHSPYHVFESLLISGIPFIAWILGLIFIHQLKKEGRELFFIVSVLYISYLLPYILVTIYSRYMIPFSAVFSLIIYFIIVLILNKALPAVKPLTLKQKSPAVRQRI